MKAILQVFSGNANPRLAEKICNYLAIPLGNATVQRFPDGEIDVKVHDDVRGSHVFVVQPTSPPVNENLMELLLLIDCLKRASADKITAVIPYFGYARQDRKAEGRVPISAKLVANLITISGANRVMAIDLHAAQLQGFFDIPTDHLFSAPVMIDYFKKLKIPNLAVVSPDIGGVKMARAFAKRLNAELAIVDKRRIGPQETEVMHIIGNIENKNAILVDDIIATGTSIQQAVEALRKAGARDIFLSATHPVLAPTSVEKIRKCNLKKLVVTDTIPIRDKDTSGINIEVLSVSNLLGEAIKRIHKNESVSSLFL